MVLFLIPLALQAQVCPVGETLIPADIPVTNADASESTFQQFSWQSFLGINAATIGGPPAEVPLEAPLWRSWSTVVDVLSCQGSPLPAGCVCPDGDCSLPGTRFYPSACRGIAGYENYRVLAQRGRFDDSFLEAGVGTVTNSPVVDRFGNFLRYEIVMSPVSQAAVIEDALWDQAVLDGNSDDIVFRCGSAGYTGGDPADPDMGNIMLKVSWMDVEGEAGAELDLDDFYTEDLLIYTPAYRSSNGIESCELRTMAMVGMHIAHKTLRQPNWIWSTFEHRDVAPNCTDAMTDPGNVDANMSCPPEVEQEFNLFGTQCNDDDPACGACNSTPLSNDPGDLCRNPTTPGLEGWCLDQPPAPAGGLSRLCRHVAVEPPVIDTVPAPIPNPLPQNYPQAAAWNQACVNELQLGGYAPWSQYMLISAQWLNASALPPEPEPPATLECDTVADDVFFGFVNADAIEPKVQTRGGQSRPFLGNITMESYGKSNCIGCHSRGVIETSGGTSYNTDFMYFPAINVMGQDSNFMSWMSGDPSSQCQLPGDPAVFEFDLTARVVNDRVNVQAMDLLLGIELPESLPDPVISPRAFDQHEAPWIQGGNAIELLPDPGCPAGSCQVDALYPARAGKTWRQYRSFPGLNISPEESVLASHIVISFEGLTCGDVNPLDLRLWVSDNSQSLYANQVDGDYLDQTLFLLPEPPLQEIEIPTVPTLGRISLGAMITLVLAIGFRAARRG